MKIGFVLDDTLDGTDGVQQYVLTLGRWLKAQGHSVHYLVGATSRIDVDNIHALSRNIKVRFNGNRLSIPLPASRHAIRGVLQQEQFDVLHVQMPYSPFLAGRIISAAPPNVRLIGTFHIFPQSELVQRASHLLAWYERRTLRRFDSVVAVSTAAQSFAQQTFGLLTRVLPNVIEVDRFKNAAPHRWQHDGPTIMYLGRLVPRKGCQTLLEAFVKLRENTEFHKTQLVFCGRGPLEAELKRYVAAQGLQELVSFEGFVSEADKPGYMQAADIAVFPSYGGESFGIVLAEAMAAGHPVVLGAANEGYSSVLKDGPGLLFPPRDAAALATRLQHFLESPAEQAAAKQWQQTAVLQYDVATVGRRLLDIYQADLRPIA